MSNHVVRRLQVLAPWVGGDWPDWDAAYDDLGREIDKETASVGGRLISVTVSRVVAESMEDPCYMVAYGVWER